MPLLLLSKVETTNANAKEGWNLLNVSERTRDAFEQVRDSVL